MSQWQPIASAPKDGTVIRLYIPGHPELEGMTGKWCSLNDEWIADPLPYSFGPPKEVPDPTMWMPARKAQTPHD